MYIADRHADRHADRNDNHKLNEASQNIVLYIMAKKNKYKQFMTQYHRETKNSRPETIKDGVYSSNHRDMAYQFIGSLT